MTAPLVGIALAAYKPDVEFFRAQLQSIADQSYQNWFCIIGFDSPMQEFRSNPSLEKFFADSRFTFVQNSAQLGVVGNFEATGLECLARSPKYIAYADQDDIWYESKIRKLVSAMDLCPAMSVVHCDMHIHLRRADGTFSDLEQTAWQLERRGIHHVSSLDFYVRNVVAGAGMLMDSELVRQFPTIPAECFGQDHWYPLVASYFGEVRTLNEPLYRYRIHGANVAGIGPYQGFFSASRDSTKLGITKKCMLAFNSSCARLRRAASFNLPVTQTERLVVSSKFDFGFGYLIKAFVVFGSDKALARACVARAIGKVLRIFNPGMREISRLS